MLCKLCMLTSSKETVFSPIHTSSLRQIEALREQYETGQEGWRAAIAERSRRYEQPAGVGINLVPLKVWM